MLKNDVKRFLRVYSKIADRLSVETEKISIDYNGRKKYLYIEPWVYKLEGILSAIIATETNPVVVEMITYSIMQGKSDKSILSCLPLSESTYYRWKRRFIEKVYNLLIADGDVSSQDILGDPIAKD